MRLDEPQVSVKPEAHIPAALPTVVVTRVGIVVAPILTADQLDDITVLDGEPGPVSVTRVLRRLAWILISTFLRLRL